MRRFLAAYLRSPPAIIGLVLQVFGVGCLSLGLFAVNMLFASSY